MRYKTFYEGGGLPARPSNKDSLGRRQSVGKGTSLCYKHGKQIEQGICYVRSGSCY
jgi:hypothetical protein